MAFEEYTITTGSSNAKSKNFVIVSVNGRNGNDQRAKNLYLLIAFGPEVIEKCQWKPGNKIAIYFGTGEDKGKALLKKVEENTATATVLTTYSKKTDSAPSLKLQRSIKPVAPIEDFVNITTPKESVAFSWDEVQQGLVITLPQGFFTASGTPSSSTSTESVSGSAST